MNKFGIWVALLSIVAASFVACTEEESDLGMGLQDPSSVFDGKVCDTITATAVTILDDSLLTSNYSAGVIGYYRDDVFGEVKASMYTQAALSTPTTGVSFNNTTIDSVRVTLVCSGIFPKESDSNSVHQLHFEVFEITEDLLLDTSYYATDSKTIAATPYFDGMVEYRLTDTAVNFLLDASVFSKFTGEFKSNDDFIEHFKGLYIRMNYNGSSNDMIYVNYWATGTGMKVFYKDENGNATEYDLLFDKSAAHFNRYEHNYSAYPLSVFQSNRSDSINGSQRLYLEALGGTSIKFRFPYLLEWKRQHPNAIVHLAEMYVSVPDEAINNNPPSSLICYRQTEAGGLVTIPDMLDGVISEGFDGVYDSNKRWYRMRITRQIQQILNGSAPDLGMRLYVNSRRSVANRCTVYGTETDKPIKLKIIYTE